jgi:hypothetical protein
MNSLTGEAVRREAAGTNNGFVLGIEPGGVHELLPLAVTDQSLLVRALRDKGHTSKRKNRNGMIHGAGSEPEGLWFVSNHARPALAY